MARNALLKHADVNNMLGSARNLQNGTSVRQSCSHHAVAHVHYADNTRFSEKYGRRTPRRLAPAHVTRRKSTTDNLMDKHMSGWTIQREMQRRELESSTAPRRREPSQRLRQNATPQSHDKNPLNRKKQPDQEQPQPYYIPFRSKVRTDVKPTNFGCGDVFRRLSITNTDPNTCTVKSYSRVVPPKTSSQSGSTPPKARSNLHRISNVPKKITSHHSDSVLEKNSAPKKSQNRLPNRLTSSLSTFSKPRSTGSNRSEVSRTSAPQLYRPPAPEISHPKTRNRPTIPQPKSSASKQTPQKLLPSRKPPRFVDHPKGLPETKTSLPPVESRYRKKAPSPKSSRSPSKPKKLRHKQVPTPVHPPRRRLSSVNSPVRKSPRVRSPRSKKSTMSSRLRESVSRLSKPKIPEDRPSTRKPRHQSICRPSAPHISTESSMKSKKHQPLRGSSRPVINTTNRFSRLTSDTPRSAHKYPPPVRLQSEPPNTPAPMAQPQTSRFRKKSNPFTSENGKLKSKSRNFAKAKPKKTNSVPSKRSGSFHTRTITTVARRITISDACTQTDQQDMEDSVPTANVAKILMSRHIHQIRNSRNSHVLKRFGAVSS